MIVGGQALRPVRALPGRRAVEVIDQRVLPHQLLMRPLATPRDVFVAIREMWVRGAPLIGAVAAYGLALQAGRDASDVALDNTAQLLRQSRPTAVNLAWALDRMLARLRITPPADHAHAHRANDPFEGVATLPLVLRSLVTAPALIRPA